jgi:uncharacterized membrane protein YeaQ/YmgE (transglycosylase-associated protein family)
VGVLGWVVVGLLAGGLARRATGSSRQGCLTTMAIGILGGVLGGALFNAAGGNGIGDFGLWSILVAFVGACVLLFLMQALGLADKRR